jgi:hypothetical protein
MKRTLVLFAVLAVSHSATFAAVNLLDNGDLNTLTPASNPALYYDTPTGWTIETDPCSSDPCAIVRYPGFPASYADRLAAGGNGVVFNSSEGNYPGFTDILTVDATLKQSVPGIPGTKYTMSGYAYFEGGYAGGVDTIDTFSAYDINTGQYASNSRHDLPSLTDTFFALEFLDGGGNVLPGSLEIELKDAGQVNNPDQTEATKNWLQHTLTAIAPAGTVSVQVRASMVDGEFNIDLPHQAAWIDDFSLTIPEPSSALLALVGFVVAGCVRRPSAT